MRSPGYVGRWVIGGEELAALRRAPPRSEGLTVPYFAALGRAQPCAYFCCSSAGPRSWPRFAALRRGQRDSLCRTSPHLAALSREHRAYLYLAE